jgi:hypothetical protein
MALIKVASDNHHLLDASGRPFFASGVNYAGYFDRAWRMWERDLFDPDVITRDFRKAQNSGFNSIRLFVHAALESDLRQGDFNKLDQVLSIAQDHNLHVMLTLNDAHSVNLARVADLDAKITERYKDVPTIFAYDLQNEPVFYNMVAAMYPDGYPAAVQTSQLIDEYGERVSRAETIELRNQRRIPVFLDDQTAYYYINALRLFLEYDRDMNNFVKRGLGTVVDFMLSAEARPWYLFIDVMDKTVDAWLRARLDPIRAAGCRQMVTMGWSWLHFSTLPANRQLDLQQYHNYADLSLTGFNTNVQHLKAMRQAFPTQPIVFGEFGWSNQSTENPDTSRPVPESVTGLYEAATYTYLRAEGFAGAIKWKLNDVDITHNPKEASFGLFKVGDKPKPIRDLLLRLSQIWPAVTEPTTFSAVRDRADGMAYRSNQPGWVVIGGSFYQDGAITWAATAEAGHCFIRLLTGELQVEAIGSGQVTIAPWQLVPGWDKSRQTHLYQLFSGDQRTRQQTFGVGQEVVIDIVEGAQYSITMSPLTPPDPPPNGLPLSEPNPGEHVVVLGDSDQYLQAALPYIRRFSPDLSFAPEDVAGRWAYVTVVATPQQIPDQVLDDIRSVGTPLVERIVDNTVPGTQAILNDMAVRGVRFRSVGEPPQPEPPAPEEPAPEPLPPVDELYVVKPGDTLGGIAKKVYGDFRLWPIIFEANRDQISNPALIRVGMELLIPPKA